MKIPLPLRCLAPSKRCVLAFRGPDAVRYLNGQLTQDTRDLSDRALASCVTDAKGRLQALVHVFRGPDDSIWVEGPAEQEEELEQRLTRYLIADDVDVENLSKDWRLIHGVDTPEPPNPGTGFVRQAARVGNEGFDLWLPASDSSEPPLSILSPAEAETRRITARIPAWGAELTAGMLPPEAGLDRNAISYHKGCYIGQEVLSRIKTAGRLNRKLTAFLVDPGTEPGSNLGTDNRSAGVITSVAPWPNEAGTHAALGYLDKSAFDEVELPITGKPGLARILGFA